MKTHWKNIILIILTAILVPATLLTVYEITSLNDSEEELRTIYDQQLETILFSVNQYSQDIISKWLTEAEEEYLKCVEKNNFDGIKEIVNSFIIFDVIIVVDEKQLTVNRIFYNDSKFSPDLFEGSDPNNKIDLTKLLNKNKEKIEKLFRYKKDGFTKYEPLEFNHEDLLLTHGESISLIGFAVAESGNKQSLLVVSLDDKRILQTVIAPKIESLAQEQLVVTIIRNYDNRVVYSSNGESDIIPQNTKPVWILPGYSLGITNAGESLESVIQWRQTVNIIVVVLFDLCLVAALLLILRYIRKESDLAQHKSDFVSNVSHELRTPISLVKMYTESLEMGRVKDEKKREEYYHVINSETDRLSRIVNKILTFSRMDAGRKKFNFVKSDLNEIVEKIVSTYSHQLREMGYKFTIKLYEQALNVNIDLDSAEEAVTNLIDNAIKYDSEKKEIIVSTGMKAGYYYFSISDKGIGISKEEQKKIFEKFYRVSSGLVHNTKGSGLGLSLVKHIMDEHGGYVEVDSQINTGSKFTLYFPMGNKES